MRKNYRIIFIMAFALCFPILSMAQGFTISGTNLIDANGNNFIIKGYSIPTAWYVSQVNSNIANMRKATNANCLRIVVQTSSADADWQTSVNNCIANDIIPIVELHDVTCGTSASGLQNMANWWASKASYLTQPQIAKYILINIANEWGDWNMAQNSPTTWRDAYKNAISTIRNAGINTTLIIDAPNCGQDIQTNTLKNYALTVLNSDPKKNCLFSIHMYCEWSTSGGSNVTTLLPALKNQGIPVMVGEFGNQENNGSGGYCTINSSAIISTCQSNGIGWLAWSWTGNNNQESFLDMSSDWAGTSLTSWGNSVVNGTYGTKTAQTCSVFLPNLGTDIALNKKVYVSSTEAGSGNVGGNLVDGSATTRWSSAYADNQKVVIDLQGVYSINAMMLNWETAYASSYSIQVSTDSITWTSVYTTSNGTGGIETHTNLSVTGRYVRIDLNTRASQWGFSLYEIGVYGTLINCSASITASGDTTFCQGGSVVLNANTGTGYSYQWYSNSNAITGQTNSTYTASASGMYSVKVTNSSGCSAVSTSKKVTANAIPSAPAVTTPLTYCQNATASALTATGTSLKWYTASTGGIGSSSAPTPATSVAGTTTYYVSQTSNNCESPRAAITVTVNSIPSAPVATSPINYCQNATASALTATGTSLKWYTASTGGSGSSPAPTPATSVAGTTTYYVSQTSNNCESPRAAITVTVNSIPSAPVVTSPVNYCQNAAASALTATGTSLNWYTTSTGGTGSTTAPTPATSVAGTTTYYVSQTSNNCESPRAAITVTVNSIPSAPVVTSPISYCQNDVASALTASGTSLKWYTASTGGSGSSSAPTPATSVSGTTTYYVSQTSNNCESQRAAITVTINSIPSAPVVTSPVNYCQNAAASALTATGTSLKWYTASTGGSGSSSAPTPSTSVSGTTTYYVSQTSNNCESQRATISVTVSTLPTASITANGSTTFCSGNNIILNANTGSGYTYQWFNGVNVLSGQINSTYTASATGSYSVQIINSNKCTSKSQSISVNVVTPLTTPVVSPSGSTSICSGNSVILSASSSNSSFQWYKNGSALSGETSSTLLAKTGGSYTVIAVGMCPSQPSVATVINSAPLNSVSISVSSNTTSACPGSPVLFTANTTGTGLTYMWMVDGNNAGGNNSTFTISNLANGDHQVSCIVTSSQSCTVGSPAVSNIITEKITPSATPTVSISSNQTSISCSDSPIDFTASAKNGGANPVYQWQVNGQNIGTNSSSISLNTLINGDAVTCILTSSLACATTTVVTSSPLTVSVTPVGTMPCANPPAAVITGPSHVTEGEQVTYIISNPDPGSAYVWSVPSGASIIGSPTGNSITVNFGSTGGDIILTETTSAGSSYTTTTTFPVNVSNGTTGIMAGYTQDMTISPNPFSEAVSIYIPSHLNSTLSIKVIDAIGNEVYSSNDYTTNQKINLGQNLASGVYIIQALYNGQVQTLRVVKL